MSTFADETKSKADDNLSKLQDDWSKISDAWIKAKQDGSKDATALRTKLDDATKKLAEGTSVWDAATKTWQETKSKFNHLKAVWEKTPGNVADKVGAVLKSFADGEKVINDAKEVADRIKAAVDKVWLEALVLEKKAVAALKGAHSPFLNFHLNILNDPPP